MTPSRALINLDYASVEKRVLGFMFKNPMDRRLFEHASRNRNVPKWKSIQLMMLYGATYRDVATRRTSHERQPKK